VGGSLFVIIDGNNLARYLVPLAPDAPVTLEIDQKLAAQLSSWAARQARPVMVELCLDPRHAPPAEQGRVQVYVAAAPASGDDAVLDRVRVHVVNGEDCLVISNDQELCAAAGEFQVDTWSVSGFVRRRDAHRPAFAPAPQAVKPGRLPGEGSPASAAARSQAVVPTPFQQRAQHFAGQMQARRRQAQIDQAIARTLANQAASCDAPVEDDRAGAAAQPAPLLHYRLGLESWPASQGARFLCESFCPCHWAEIASLVGHPAGLQAADLPVLAGLLLECCGQESDFVRRGGSLMDRVRLALLLAGPVGLSLPELARQTGAAPAALQRRLRRSGGKWLA